MGCPCWCFCCRSISSGTNKHKRILRPFSSGTTSSVTPPRTPRINRQHLDALETTLLILDISASYSSHLISSVLVLHVLIQSLKNPVYPSRKLTSPDPTCLRCRRRGSRSLSALGHSRHFCSQCSSHRVWFLYWSRHGSAPGREDYN